LPVFETDFLKGLIDPNDKFHSYSTEALEKVKTKRWYVASSAFLELDLLLKNSRIPIDDRTLIFQTLKSEIPRETILIISPETLVQALFLQKKYPKIPKFYFDSLHLASATMLDHQIVSSDRSFDEIEEIRRIPLESI